MYTFMDLPEQNFDSPMLANSIYLLGLGFDGTACYRTGQRLAPSATRLASNNLETYSLNLDRDMLDYPIKFFDMGDLPYSPNHFPTLMKNFKRLHLNTQAKLLCIGGEHSISYMPLSWYLKAYNNLAIVHLDAHADFRVDYLGHEISHASVIGQIEKKMSPEQHLFQFGIRSGTKEEFSYIKKMGYLQPSLEALCDKIATLPKGHPIYLTVDVDFFDPSQIPGTGTPEAGGHDYFTFEKILKLIMERGNLVGGDIVELCPQLDPSGRSECMVAKMVREMLLAMA